VVPIYKNRAPIEVRAPVPLHMHERLRACGWQGEAESDMRPVNTAFP
jgi:tRNA pseudouridine32 synthase/23S rRNA pseudouridine746 synthase